MPELSALSGLPAQVRARHVENGNGLRVHILEAGFDRGPRPALLLLHGFPELAYSWRKVMLPLADAGYHVIAPDQRGYGRTTGWSADYETDLTPFSIFNLVRDQIGLLSAMNIEQVAGVVGHDFGSPVAAWCALARPDIFNRVALMSAPFGGPPQFAAAGNASVAASIDHQALLDQNPPRLHYQWYYSTRGANENMMACEQGVHDFLRAYYHVKSADWPQNKPYRLPSWDAQELARMPTYYIMHASDGMAQAVAPHMPTAQQVAQCHWLPESELAVYSGEYQRTGFQGGLQWYRCATGQSQARELRLFARRRIDVPACFIGGTADWGVYQKPGDFEKMQNSACARMSACHLVDGAGHWVQQEQPEKVVELLLAFLGDGQK